MLMPKQYTVEKRLCALRHKSTSDIMRQANDTYICKVKVTAIRGHEVSTY